jgi:hypothetical protein
VHEETTQLTTELLSRWSADGGDVVKIEHAVTLTSRLTVMITAIAGESCLDNNFPLSQIYALSQALATGLGGMTRMRHIQDTKWWGIWNYIESLYLTNGLTLQTFRTALSTLLNNFPLRVLFSDSILMFTKTGRGVVTAFKELRVCYSCHKLDPFTYFSRSTCAKCLGNAVEARQKANQTFSPT